MIIRPSHFDNGKEVDITSNYVISLDPLRKGRLSVRRDKDGCYYVYTHDFLADPGSKDRVLIFGTDLNEIIKWTNKVAGMSDEVQEDA